MRRVQSPGFLLRVKSRAASASGARTMRWLKARVVQMWQTRLLRVSRLTVRDEIENALSYYHTTFLLCARSPGSTLSSKNVAMERASSSVAQTVSAATNRMFARVTASQIASASAESFFCRLT
jgi:phosphoenolpyruvate carboxylase